MFETNFLGHRAIWGAQKHLRVTAPDCPPVAGSLGITHGVLIACVPLSKLTLQMHADDV